VTRGYAKVAVKRVLEPANLPSSFTFTLTPLGTANLRGKKQRINRQVVRESQAKKTCSGTSVAEESQTKNTCSRTSVARESQTKKTCSGTSVPEESQTKKTCSRRSVANAATSDLANAATSSQGTLENVAAKDQSRLTFQDIALGLRHLPEPKDVNRSPRHSVTSICDMPSRREKSRREKSLCLLSKKFFNEDYEKIDDLGEGASSAVHLARCKKKGGYVAIKAFATIQEVRALQTVSEHPHVIKVLDVALGEGIGQPSLILEYGGASLYNHLRNGQMPMNRVIKISQQVLSALAYLHSKMIIHNDLTPGNIALGNDDFVRIVDFGNSIIDEKGCREVISEQKIAKEGINQITMWYRPVEVLLGQSNYTNAADLWSFGCILAEMLSGSVLFQESCQIGMIFSIFRKLGSPTDDDRQILQQLPFWRESLPSFPGEYPPASMEPLVRCALTSLLCLAPCRRWSAKDALNSPLFKISQQASNSCSSQACQSGNQG